MLNVGLGLESVINCAAAIPCSRGFGNSCIMATIGLPLKSLTMLPLGIGMGPGPWGNGGTERQGDSPKVTLGASGRRCFPKPV